MLWERCRYRYESVKLVVATAFKSASDLVALCVIIVLFVVFSALFGMHMFGGRCEACAAVSSRYLYSLQDPEYSTMCARRVRSIDPPTSD